MGPHPSGSPVLDDSLVPGGSLVPSGSCSGSVSDSGFVSSGGLVADGSLVREFLDSRLALAMANHSDGLRLGRCRVTTTLYRPTLSSALTLAQRHDLDGLVDRPPVIA